MRKNSLPNTYAGGKSAGHVGVLIRGSKKHGWIDAATDFLPLREAELVAARLRVKKWV